MTLISRITVVATGALLGLAGCATVTPTSHDTPGWDDRVSEVQDQLIELAPSPAPAESPAAAPDPGGYTTSSPNGVATGFAELVVGECILYPYDEQWNFADIVSVVPCDEPHYGEVYATGELSQSSYSADLATGVADSCVAAFAGFVGGDYWSSSLYYDYTYPSQVGWDDGLRRWTCMVVEGDYENTGSLRNADI